jgi:hypothetical protein
VARRRDYAAEYAARQARARAAGHPSYYAKRVAGYQARHPGASRSAARGHGSRGERAADDLLRTLSRLPSGSSVHFAGTDRQPDGTWRTARFDVFAGDGSAEHTFEISEDALDMLPSIRDAIASSGFVVLGADYLETMVEWVEDHMPEPPPVYAIAGRSGRYVSGTAKNGNAITRRFARDAFTSTDRRRVSRFLTKTKLASRGYRIVAL